MASVNSPINSNSRDVDSLITPTGITGLMKRGLHSQSVSGGDSNVADQAVGTHVDDAALTVAADSVVAVGGFADETSSDSVDEGDVGALRMGLDRVLLTRDHGPVTERVVHAINISTSAASIGTGIAANRRHIDVYNGGTVTVFLGPSGVGTATGIPLGTASYYYETGSIAIYGITASGTAALRVQERR